MAATESDVRERPKRYAQEDVNKTEEEKLEKLNCWMQSDSEH
jgi:hypothetical protein